MKKIQGIYAIRNLINDKMYIGQVCKNKGLKRRFLEHKSSLNNNKHFNKHLQNSWNKYKEINFEFILLEEVSDKINLNDREKYWIDSNFNCYNIQKIPGNYINKTQSLETRIKIGLANAKRKWTIESRKRLSQSQKNKVISDSFREKRRIIQLEKRHSEKTKLKISIGNKNKIVSIESKIKMSKAKLGIKPSIESINKRFITLLRKSPNIGTYKGVRNRSRNSWESRIFIKSKTISFGSFSSDKEAAMNYDYHVRYLYKKYNPYLNFNESDFLNFIPKKSLNEIVKIINI